MRACGTLSVQMGDGGGRGTGAIPRGSQEDLVGQALLRGR